MKYIDEFRDGERARGLARALHTETRPDRSYRLMEFCGGHTHAVFRYGIPDLLPANIELIHGPGCPVCVLPDRPAGYGHPPGVRPPRGDPGQLR